MLVIARRLFFYLVTAAVAISLDFLIPRLIPGNPVDAILAKMQGVTITPAIIHALDLQFGVNTSASLWGQYTHFWDNVLHGNFGVSSANAFEPVSTVIRQALPYTLGLVGVATLISFLLGTAIGAIVAWKRGSWLDNVLPVVTFFQAAPYFFLAFLAIDVFAVMLGWFPPSRAANATDFPAFTWTYLSDVLDHAVLPALTIVVASAAGWIVGMRNVMLTTMDEDYVLIAAAKGLRKGRVIWYAARNAILPSVSGFALAIGFIMSGALLTEIVFSYPGLGSLLLQAVSNNDYELMQGLFLIITFTVLAANLIADFVYVFLDPRTRQEA
ncbi:MAG TPA: ABC transporter permease [Streptosporangiaceae bacterium]|jgi:peptide/nickel transport system permease protein|nr:ABC transporter permease [Streptosporangiaceae bacterium]